MYKRALMNAECVPSLYFTGRILTMQMTANITRSYNYYTLLRRKQISKSTSFDIGPSLRGPLTDTGYTVEGPDKQVATVLA